MAWHPHWFWSSCTSRDPHLGWHWWWTSWPDEIVYSMAGRFQDFFRIHEDMRYMSNLNILVFSSDKESSGILYLCVFIRDFYVISIIPFFSTWKYRYSQKQCIIYVEKSLASDSIHQVFFPKVCWDTGLTIAMILPIAVVEQESDLGEWFRQSTDW